MTRCKKLCLVFGLMLTLYALPVPAREIVTDRETSFMAISTLPPPQVQERLDKVFYRWESYDLDLPALERQVRDTGRVTLYAGGRVFAMNLEVNSLRAPGYKSVRQTRHGSIEEKPSPVATFKGHLVGDPKSTVRLLIQPNFLQGYIRTADEWIFIDSLRKYEKSSTPTEIVLFDNDDVRPEAVGQCGAQELADRAHRLTGARASSGSLASVSEKALIVPPTRGQVDIATEADYEYYSLYGASTNSQIESTLNGVDGIFQAELALKLRIVFQSVWTWQNDPYDKMGTDLVGQFANYWNEHRKDVARDLAYLFTGKNLLNPTGQPLNGVAYLGKVCRDQTMAYGLSRNHSLIIKLTAHEIGHLFNAEHDDRLNPPAHACTGDGPIMCNDIGQQVNGPKEFSNPSKTAITAHVNSYGTCLERLPTTYFTNLTNQIPNTESAGTSETGHQFSSSQNGYITAVRFWKHCSETGTHVGRLWTNSGQPLASVTFTNETACGWQEQYLPYRVKITAGTLYWVTYNVNAWQAKTGCGISPWIANGPLTAWGSAYSNPNATPSTIGTFPNNGSCSNFFADVYFTY